MGIDLWLAHDYQSWTGTCGRFMGLGVRGELGTGKCGRFLGLGVRGELGGTGTCGRFLGVTGQWKELTTTSELYIGDLHYWAMAVGRWIKGLSLVSKPHIIIAPSNSRAAHLSWVTIGSAPSACLLLYTSSSLLAPRRTGV